MNPLVRSIIDEWSTREKLILASAVLTAGDQNWHSVSRQCKPFGEPKRPADWFNAKNCATQYSQLLDNQETPKRKRGEKSEDTSQKLIVRKLTNERIEELKLKIEEDRVKLDHLSKNISLLKNDNLSETDLKIIQNQMQESLRQAKKDEEKHELWLKERAEKYALLNSRKKSIGILKTPKKDDSLSGLNSLPSTPIKTPTTPLTNLSSALSNQQQDSQSTEQSNKEQSIVDEKQKSIKQENLIQSNQEELNKSKDKQQTSKDDKVQIFVINETEKQASSDKITDIAKDDKQNKDNQLNDKNKIEITVVQPQVVKMEICESTKSDNEDNNKETTEKPDESREQSESIGSNKRKRTSSSVSSQSNTPTVATAQQTPTQTRRSGRIKPTTRTSLNQSITTTPKSQDTSIIENQPKKTTIIEEVTSVQKHAANQLILNDESTKDSTTSDLTDNNYTSPNSPASSILNIESSDPEQLKEYRIWKKSILQLWRQAQTHKFSSLFLSPVTDDEAKDYSSVVLKPIDLTMIKKKIENGTIKTTQEFQRDIMLMFQNAIMYNDVKHPVHGMAIEFQKEMLDSIEDFINNQEENKPSNSLTSQPQQRETSNSRRKSRTM